MKLVGCLVVLYPTMYDANENWITVIIPAYKGQVEIGVQINYVHIESALSGFKDESDVFAFLTAHKPWTYVNYECWS
jgi:hypothetical protein